jgi:hypothetical protein
MVPPIRLCQNGHSSCSNCSGRGFCPICGGEFSGIRCLALENIVRRQKYPCAKRQSGCLEFFSIEHIAKHQARCVYGKIECPSPLLAICSWKGLKEDVKEHVKAEHQINFVEGSTFLDSSLSASWMFVSYFGEIFVYYKKKRDGRYYAAVQLIGTSSEASKYKCEFTLSAANGIEQISKTLFVRGYSEDWETIFNSGKCFNVDEGTIKIFVVEGKLKMGVELSTVE